MRSRSIPGNTNSDGESHDIGLQNGMTHLDIASVVGAERTIGAIIEIASNMFVPRYRQSAERPGRALVRARGGGSRQQYRIEDVAKLLRCPGRVEVTSDIKSCKWMKLIVNTAELIPSAIPQFAARRRGALPRLSRVMRQAGYTKGHSD